MVYRRIGADHDDDFGVHGRGKRRRHRARTQALEQRRDLGVVRTRVEETLVELAGLRSLVEL